MKLRILTPSELFEFDGLEKITADGDNGYFTLLPNHIDCAAALVPGILTYTDGRGVEKNMAVDEGTLVKKGFDVFVSCRAVAAGEMLGVLGKNVREKFEQAQESEKRARAMIAMLEADFLKKFLGLKL